MGRLHPRHPVSQPPGSFLLLQVPCPVAFLTPSKFPNVPFLELTSTEKAPEGGDVDAVSKSMFRTKSQKNIEVIPFPRSMTVSKPDGCIRFGNPQ